jgi:hypothetical protein
MPACDGFLNQGINSGNVIKIFNFKEIAVASMPPRLRRINHSETFRRFRKFAASWQGLIKVDGTFV